MACLRTKRTGLQGRFAYIGLVQHTNDDHFRHRETITKPAYHSRKNYEGRYIPIDFRHSETLISSVNVAR